MTHPRDMQVYEILEELQKTPSDKLKVELLTSKYSDHTPLQYILKWNFCETIQNVLPEGAPPFNTEEEDGPSKASLWQYIQVFPSFVKSAQSANMRMLHVERVFIEMLEALDRQEAEVICQVKDGKLGDVWNLPVQVVMEAFPGLIVTTNSPLKERTPQEEADELLLAAKAKREQAKILQSEAKRLTQEAKDLIKNTAE